MERTEKRQPAGRVDDRMSTLTPLEVRALHITDRWTRIGAWGLLITLGVSLFRGRYFSLDWSWLWVYPSYERSQWVGITALMTVPTAAIICLFAVHPSVHRRERLLTIAPTAAYFAYAAVAGLGYVRVGGGAAPALTSMHVFLARPLATYLLLVITAASLVRLREPDRGGLRSIVGWCGAGAVALLLLPLPESWILRAGSELFEAEPLVAPILVLAVAATAAAAAMSLRTRPRKTQSIRTLARALPWIVALGLTHGLSRRLFAAESDWVPRNTGVGSIIPWMIFISISILVCAGLYRVLTLRVAADTRFSELEDTFS